MTGTFLAVREQQRANVALTNDQLHFISATEFVPPGLRGNLPAIMACVATGRALGIDDMSSLRLIHMVNGRPTFSAELMVQIVRRAGHSITGESKAGACTVVGTRKDNGDSMTVTWTIEMAQRAGLANKQTWKAYPEALLWARAASQLCRMLFADCFAGNTYTPEELGDEDSGQGERSSENVVATPVPNSSGGDLHAAAADPHRVAWEQRAATSSGGEPNEDASSSQPITTPDQAASPPADVPFGDDYDAPILPAGVDADKPPTKKQIDALNGLVKQLENAGHITTLQVWQSMGIEPTSSDYEILEDGAARLRWSPLRDQLTRSQAHQLLDRLIPFADQKLPKDAA